MQIKQRIFVDIIFSEQLFFKIPNFHIGYVKNSVKNTYHVRYRLPSKPFAVDNVLCFSSRKTKSDSKYEHTHFPKRAKYGS